ncbi:MAG: diguanylate cyclase [Sulfurospirillaceae bacterium]|nr:diguanylate cyclase [Sulfurospirillaceae bacterium]
MVRLDKSKIQDGVRDIEKQENVEIETKSTNGQQAHSELEKFSLSTLKTMIDETIPTTPNNFQIYFEKLLENKPLAFKKRINEFLETETINADENHAKLEQEIKDGFAQIRNIMQVVSVLYKNLTIMKEIVKKRSSELELTSTQLAVKNVIASLNEDLKKLSTITEKQIEVLKEHYQKATVIVKDVENKSIFDVKYGVYNKRYVSKAIEDEVKSIKNFKHASTLVFAKLKESSIEKVESTKDRDIIIRNTAKLLLKTSRRSDIVAHYGNGLFVILMKHTDLNSGKKACDRISELVCSANFFMGGSEISTDIELAITPIDAKESLDDYLMLVVDSMEKTGKALVPYVVCTQEIQEPTGDS